MFIAAGATICDASRYSGVVPLRPHAPRSTARSAESPNQIPVLSHLSHLTSITSPPVTASSSAGVSRTTVRGVPAAAQMEACRRRSWSIKMRKGVEWPTGGTPPMANPVTSRTKPGLAFSIGSPTKAATRCSLTRFAPLGSRESARHFAALGRRATWQSAPPRNQSPAPLPPRCACSPASAAPAPGLRALRERPALSVRCWEVLPA